MKKNFFLPTLKFFYFFFIFFVYIYVLYEKNKKKKIYYPSQYPLYFASIWSILYIFLFFYLYFRDTFISMYIYISSMEFFLNIETIFTLLSYTIIIYQHSYSKSFIAPSIKQSFCIFSSNCKYILEKIGSISQHGFIKKLSLWANTISESLWFN